MKNNDGDYLWDRTGEPDPEVQQLEQVLGTLRYQPRSLDIPAGLAPGHKRASFPRYLAIAATIAVMLLGVGLWLGLQRQQNTTQVSKAPTKPGSTSGGNQTAVGASNKGNGPTASLPAIDRDSKPIRDRVNPGMVSRELARSRRPTLNTAELTADERKEAAAAKEQLMLALRVASSKLNFAQKKAQEINSDNLVHNQHKIG